MLFYFTQKRGSGRMTKKQELLKAYEEVKGKVLDCIVLDIHMPTGETETITNPNLEEKIKYIEKTYNDDLVHPSCKQIYIEDYSFIECQGGFDFGLALGALKYGKKVARRGWNGKKQYIELAAAISYVNADGDVVNCNHEAIGNKAIAFVGTSGVQMGWLASQADMLAEDWMIVE